MAKPTPLRDPSLTSEHMRKSLAHRANEPTFTGVMSAIDQMRAMYDGLEQLYAADDPTQTKEARALAYKQSYDRMQATADRLVEAQVNKLVAYEHDLRQEAWKASGLDTAPNPHEASEIRSALRSMSDKDRDKAVANALDKGDRSVIAAVAHSPSPVLTGPLTVAKDALIEQYIHKINPTLKRDLADVEDALNRLNLAVGGFRRSAGRLRDPMAEVRGEEGRASAKAAQEALEEALAASGL